MYCECQGWVRIPTEEDSKYPISNHHSFCKDYKLEKFLRIEYDGRYCIMEPHEAKAMMEDDECQYIVSEIFLTRDQFENLSEFEGF